MNKQQQGRIDPVAALLQRSKPKKGHKKRDKGSGLADRLKNSQPEPELAADDSTVMLQEALLASLSNTSNADNGRIEASAESAASHTSSVANIARQLQSVGKGLEHAIVPGPKKNRQKARLAQRAAAEEAVRKQAQVEVEAAGSDSDLAAMEERSILEMCYTLQVTIVEVNPDGHCLYSAIADQLNFHGAPQAPPSPTPSNSLNPFKSSTYTALKVAVHRPPGPHTFASCRQSAASYMRAHPNDFLPYLLGDDGNGDLLKTESQYQAYCDAVENSSTWGGQPEILALSRCFRYPIHVLQANTPIVKVGQEDSDSDSDHRQVLLISYHRHMYGLGEHYNSLRPTS